MANKPWLTFIFYLHDNQADLLVNMPKILPLLKENEAIIVDDGSVDGGAELCRRWIEQGYNVRIIRNENTIGRPQCWNIGLREAQGQYVSFADMKDFIYVSYGILVKQLIDRTQADVLHASFYLRRDYDGPSQGFEGLWVTTDERLDSHVLYSEAPKVKIENQLLAGKWKYEPWGDFYRKDFLENNEICFQEGGFSFLLFQITCLAYADKVVKMNEVRTYVHSLLVEHFQDFSLENLQSARQELRAVINHTMSRADVDNMYDRLQALLEKYMFDEMHNESVTLREEIKDYRNDLQHYGERHATLEEHKKILLQGLCYFRDFCREHGLRYYLDAGTLIGAVRHQGFIPWDDDIDVVMPRPDYDRMIKLAEKMNNEDWKLNCFELNSDYLFHFAKLSHRKSLRKPSEFVTGMTLGIYVDIFPLDGCKTEPGEEEPLAAGQRYMDRMKERSAYAAVPTLVNSLETRPLNRMKFLQMEGQYGNFNKRLHDFTNELRQVAFDEAEWCIAGVLTDKVEINRREWFDETVEMMFEGELFACPKDYHKILTKYYGDYMQLPPEGERMSHNRFKTYILDT